MKGPLGARAPRAYLVTACFSQLGLFRQASKQGIPPHRSRDIWDSWAKVDLQACKSEAGNAANVPLLHELQHPGVNRCAYSARTQATKGQKDK